MCTLRVFYRDALWNNLTLSVISVTKLILIALMIHEPTNSDAILKFKPLICHICLMTLRVLKCLSYKQCSDTNYQQYKQSQSCTI